jgi:hypothetical protein
VSARPFSSRIVGVALAAGLVSGSACGDDAALTPDELLAKSCAGERLDACEPYAYAIVTSGSLAPERLRVGDLRADGRVQARYRNCGAATPARHRLRVDAVTTVTVPDAGPSERAFFLLEAEDTDGDGAIDTTVPNPFDTGFPPDTRLTLRFTPRIEVPITLPDGTISVRACEGAPLTVPYTTGERFVVVRDGGV